MICTRRMDGGNSGDMAPKLQNQSPEAAEHGRQINAGAPKCESLKGSRVCLSLEIDLEG